MNAPEISPDLYRNVPTPSADKQMFFEIVGMLVFLLQDVEYSTRVCEEIVFGVTHPQTEDLFKTDKRPLGRLINDLKAKTEVASDFGDILTAMVDNRNILIHRAQEQPWWNPETEEQFAAAFAFLRELLDQVGTVKLTFDSIASKFLSAFPGGDAQDLEPWKSSGYLDAVKMHEAYSDRAIVKRVSSKDVPSP